MAGLPSCGTVSESCSPLMAVTQTGMSLVLVISTPSLNTQYPSLDLVIAVHTPFRLMDTSLGGILGEWRCQK